MTIKRTSILFLAAAALAAGVSGTAAAGDFPNPFGQQAVELARTEALIDAARSFEKVDIDGNKLIDEDEYASQRVVRAQLTRFSAQLAIDGVETTHIELPEQLAGVMDRGQQAALDAVARRDFHLRASGKEGLDQNAWQDARVEEFNSADQDGDGILKGRELTIYARLVAGDLSASFAGT